MDHLLVLLLLLWSSGLQAAGEHTSTEFLRLASRSSRCAGTLELKREGHWRPVAHDFTDWTLKEAAAVCTELNCGSAVSLGTRSESPEISMWWIRSECLQSGSSLRDCARIKFTKNAIVLTCLDSVRLLNGTSLCSGRLEVRSNQSDQRWSSVCEAGFDLQDAEVVCREFGCGAPSVLQGALYGEVEAPKWTKEFQCEGHESALVDCRSSERNTCSAGRAAGLTCSEPVRLVGGDSRCAGKLELKHLGKWRPVSDIQWSLTLIDAAVMCRELDCGSAVSVGRVNQVPTYRPMWEISSHCLQSGFSLRECAAPFSSSYKTDVTCSDVLFQPNISVSVDGVSEAQQQGFQVSRGSSFNISCSVQPQYPGGSFKLRFTSSDSSRDYTRPAVNHSASFPFPAAEPAHHGTYSCVYGVRVFSHDFSSESRLLSVTVSDSSPFIIRAAVLPLILLMANTVLYLCFCRKAGTRQKVDRQEDTELDHHHPGERAPSESEGAQGAE